MEIQEAKRAEIVVEIDGAKLTFAPSVPHDLTYAANVIQVMASESTKITPVQRDAVASHVFSKLKAVEGVRSNGEDLTVEKLQAIAPKAPAKSIMPIIFQWALAVYDAEGLLPSSEAEEKKDLTGNLPLSDS